MRHDIKYTFLFATIVCVVCGVLVSWSAVSLADRQAENAALDKMKNVLMVSGLAKQGEKLSAEQARGLFEQAIKPVAVELATGKITGAIDPAEYDQRAAAADPKLSRPAPPNPAKVKRLPKYAVIYEVVDKSGQPTMLVLPVEGYGLWSTLYGFLALDVDLDTIRGLSYYEQGETAGLGGEVDNPRWKALWPGRKVFDKSGQVAIAVIKGHAGPPDTDPYHVDGLSGATLTSRGVTNMLHFWLSDAGFGPFLKNYGASRKDG